MRTMRISDGAASILSAVVVTGLAAGLGLGAHILLEEAGPVDEPPPGSSAGPMATDGDLCDVMEGMLAFTKGFNASQASSNALLNGDVSDDEAFIEALHSIGQAIIDGTRQVAGYFSQAADLVAEPEVAEAFDTVAYAQEELGRVQGEIVLGIESLDEYWALAMEPEEDDSEVSSLLEEGEAAVLIVQPYVYEACGINILSVGADIGTSLKADASTLGREVMAYFVDWDESESPVITEDEDYYFLDGVRIGPRSLGVSLFEQQYNDAADWCVSVTSTDGTGIVYHYSAQFGLAEGACSSLQP